MFILLKHTYEYDVNNVSPKDSIGLHVIFNEYVSSASYFWEHMTTFPFVSSVFFLYIFCSQSINPVYCSLKLWEIVEFVFSCLSNKGVINLILAC